MEKCGNGPEAPSVTDSTAWRCQVFPRPQRQSAWALFTVEPVLQAYKAGDGLVRLILRRHVAAPELLRPGQLAVAAKTPKRLVRAPAKLSFQLLVRDEPSQFEFS